MSGDFRKTSFTFNFVLRKNIIIIVLFLDLSQGMGNSSSVATFDSLNLINFFNVSDKNVCDVFVMIPVKNVFEENMYKCHVSFSQHLWFLYLILCFVSTTFCFGDTQFIRSFFAHTLLRWFICFCSSGHDIYFDSNLITHVSKLTRTEYLLRNILSKKKKQAVSRIHFILHEY